MELADQLELSAFQSQILEALATGNDFAAIADLLCRKAEALSDGAICTIVRIENGLIRPVSAPSLPAAYAEALDGAAIGPEAGSCGTAAYLGEPVLSADIDNDPKWQPYLGLAQPYGLKACWSSPIKARDGRTIATFAFYFREKRDATEIERELVKRSVHLCAIALEHIQINSRNEFLAFRDQLTGLGNRRSFDTVFHDPDFSKQPFGLLLVDIDNLKIVNDSLGHWAGDTLISVVASRIDELSAPDRVFRLGGDEFAVLCRGCHDDKGLRKAALTLIDGVSQPITALGSTITPSVTIGGVLSGCDGAAPEQLRQHADVALYHGKETNPGGYQRFDPGHKTSIMRRIEESHQLLQALDEDRLTAHFQPVVSLETGRIAGVEALARIRATDGRILSAQDFQLAFADVRNAARLTTRMLDIAVRELRGWLDQGLRIEHLALNLSPADFRTGDLEARVSEAFDRVGLPLHYLQVEVTETVMMDGRVVDPLNRLRARGVRIALDDFGTGFASLTHLLNTPFDIIKIDRSFIEKLLTDPPSAAVVEALIDIARKLRVDIVAEGVETFAQVERLCELGCPFGQGYLFSRPVDADTTAQLLRATLPLVNDGASARAQVGKRA